MGDGVSGAGNAPANQPTNRSGDTSAADAATKAKFDQAAAVKLDPPANSDTTGSVDTTA